MREKRKIYSLGQRPLKLEETELFISGKTRFRSGRNNMNQNRQVQETEKKKN